MNTSSDLAEITVVLVDRNVADRDEGSWILREQPQVVLLVADAVPMCDVFRDAVDTISGGGGLRFDPRASGEYWPTFGFTELPADLRDLSPQWARFGVTEAGGYSRDKRSEMWAVGRGKKARTRRKRWASAAIEAQTFKNTCRRPRE
ncbi:MAG: hypothetical protein WCP28_14955 [Actinomycetes bacterium]